MIWVREGILARSFQPDFELLRKHKAYGIRAVVNLRAETQQSLYLCRDLGLKYYHIPVEDMGFPAMEQVNYFLHLFEDVANIPMLVHCHAGIGRTGIFCAAYRMCLGADPEEAIRLTDLEAAQHVQLLEPQANFIRSLKQ